MSTVLDQLKQQHLEEITLVIYLSDNGGTHTPNLPASSKHYIGSLNTPVSGQKGNTVEGGIIYLEKFAM